MTRAQMNMLEFTEPHMSAPPVMHRQAPRNTPFFLPYLSPTQPVTVSQRRAHS